VRLTCLHKSIMKRSQRHLGCCAVTNAARQ
jgi:hypothetical protein